MIFTTSSAALQNLGITQNNTEEIIEFETAPCLPDSLYSNWAQYPKEYPI